MYRLGCSPESSSKLQSIGLALSSEHSDDNSTWQSIECFTPQSRYAPPAPSKTSNDALVPSFLNVVQARDSHIAFDDGRRRSQSWPQTMHDRGVSHQASHCGTLARLVETTCNDTPDGGTTDRHRGCFLHIPTSHNHGFHNSRSAKPMHATLPRAAGPTSRRFLDKEQRIEPLLSLHGTAATSFADGSHRQQQRRRSPSIAIPKLRLDPQAEADDVERAMAVRAYNSATWRLYHRIVNHRQQLSSSTLEGGSGGGKDTADDDDQCFSWISCVGSTEDNEELPAQVETSYASNATIDEGIFIMDL
jgi:hypothetical protein